MHTVVCVITTIRVGSLRLAVGCANSGFRNLVLVRLLGSQRMISMNTLSEALPIIVTLTALLLPSSLTQADGNKVRGGTLACGGNQYSRVAGSELHRT